MTPKDNNGSTKRSKKGDEGEDSEEQTARLLTEDPLDWMLKNDQVSNMLSVRKSFTSLELFNCFVKAFKDIVFRNVLPCL